MKIRVLDEKDATIYKQLRLQALQEHPEAFSSSYEEESNLPITRTEKRLKGEDSITFGAFKENECIGVATLLLNGKNKTKHRADIAAVYVSSEHRQNHIGRKLMVEAINKAQTFTYIEQIYLVVNVSNQPARKLYQSLGFKTYGMDKRALKVGDQYYDEELMVLFLEEM